MIKQHRSTVGGLFLGWVLILLTSGIANAKNGPIDHGTTVFPTTGLLPKEEIGALDFLEKYPEADGRGVIVAILDTGVDPGAPGLSVTPTGEPKILAVVDATGSGDVPTETVVELSKNGTLKGLTGKELQIGKTWNNPSGKYHLGMVAGYEIFPEELVERLQDERKEDWNAKQRELERSIQAQIDAFKKTHENPVGDDLEKLKDLEKTLEVAVAFRDEYEDPGPIYDCVVFHDGTVWRAVVDTDTDADLSDEKVLANFDVEQQYSTFGDDSLLNFAVNIYEDGKLLSIVADTGMHGTHVAGIVGAYFKDQPELNGVAPGVQLVSIKIGDTRLGGMETPHAMSRAINAIKKYGCDMVNQSYGEAIRYPKRGHVIEELISLVDDHQVIFVSSAGNDGPALTTVGAPGGTTSSLIGVGATITPNLMKSSYSILKDLPATQFTWSSRGPTIDGDLGVDISAPGGAISPVPRWELSKNMRANGTSMAGPDACGGLALVLSALKQDEKAYTSVWVKRAVTQAAATIEGVDVFGQGHGMIQVEETYEILKALPEQLLATPGYSIEVGSDGMRGIYLRNGDLIPAKQTFTVNVKAKFPEDTDNEVKADFEARYVLKATEDWVGIPDFVFVNSLEKRFDVQVDTSELTPGAHYAEVCAFDPNHMEAGPLFRLPVTVVKPTILEEPKWDASVSLDSGEIERYFFQVPSGATWAELEIEAPTVHEPVLLVVHPQHTIPGERYVNVGASYYLRVSEERPQIQEFPVMEGATMELALAQYWSELESADFEFKLTFHGLETELGDGVYSQGEGGEKFRVVSLLKSSVLSPSAQFDHLYRTVAAGSAELSVCTDPRDELSEDGEAYHQLILQYAFNLEEATTLTPIFEMLNDKIYEVEFESQLQMIFDSNKQLLETNDTFPDPVSLDEGDYTFRLHLRHKDRAVLESLKSLNLTLAMDLASPVSVKSYTSTDDLLLGQHAKRNERLARNTRTPLTVSEPSADDLPAFLKAGDRLVGSLQLEKGAPVSTPLQWVFTGSAFTEDEEADLIEAPEPGLEESVSDVLLKLAAKYRDQKDKASFDAIINEKLKNSPRTLAVALEKLRWFVDADENGESSTQIKKLAKLVIKQIDEDEVAAYFGKNHQIDDTESKVLQDSKELERNALIEAYAAIALASSKSGVNEDQLKLDMDKLLAWTTSKEIDKRIRKSLMEAKNQTGSLLDFLSDSIADDITDKKSYEQRIKLMESQGETWQHVVDYEKAWMHRRFPEKYARF